MKELSFYPKVSEIVINPSEGAKSFCETFVYEPENIEEEKMGFLYLAGQIKNKIEDNQQSTVSQAAYFLNLIASYLSRSFYQKKSFTPKDALEKSLAEVNGLFVQQLDEGKLKRFKEINLFVALFIPSQNKICFSVSGRIEGFLWRKGQISSVIGNAEQKPNQLITEKPFKSIVEGQIMLGDKLIFSIPAITNKISSPKLKRLIDKLRYSDLGKIKDFLSVEEDESLAILILDIRPQKESVPLAKKIKPEAKYVTSPAPAKVSANIRKEKKKKIGVLMSVSLLSVALILRKKTFPFLKGESQKLSKWTSVLLKKVSKIQLNKFSLSHLKNISQRLSFRKETLNPLRRIPAKIYFQKRYLLFGISIVVLIIAGLILLHPRQKKAAPPSNPKEQIIRNPVPLLNLKLHTLSFAPLGVEVRDSNFIFFDKNSFYIFGRKTQKGNFLFPDLPSGDFLVSSVNIEGNQFYLSQKGKIISLDKNLKISRPKEVKGLSKEIISDGSSFENNLYLLTKSGKIIKYPHLNFDKPVIWLNKGKDMGQNLLSLSIDGSIYLLEKSGMIRKYTRGKLDNNFLITLKDLAHEGDKIFTSPQLKTLYVLSRSQNKIFIFNKEKQTLVKEISSPIWQDMINFFIAPDGKIIYLLNNLTLYQINI